MSSQEIIHGVADGTLDDDVIFDSLFPEWARDLSYTHWTPVRVGRWVASLLTERRADSRILDVGSGVGKFCIIGALTTSAHFTGVEQRPRFVELSRRLASLAGTSRAHFILGNFMDLDWSDYNGIYLFNPFQENIPFTAHIDDTVPLHRKLYAKYVEAVEQKLDGMPPGTRVVTYFGFGGRFPPSYQRLLSTFFVRGIVEYWIKM